jgi:hypothetical protein
VVPYTAGSTPLPGYGTHPPGSKPPTAPPPTVTPTTLGASAGAVTAAVPPARSGRGGMFAVLGLLAAAGAGATFALTRPDEPKAATPPPIVTFDAAVPMAAPPDAAPPDAGTPDAQAAAVPETVTPPDAAIEATPSRERSRRERTRRERTNPTPESVDIDGDGIPDVR